ncbi:hypothetical protein SGLAM104S_01137 [Streptomyces glaucescens]
MLGEARTHLAERPAPPAVKYTAGDGAPSAALCELSAEAQLLVLGSRGRGGFASLLLGSNSLSTARDAECPVVVVPRPGREQEDVPAAEPGPRVVVGLNVDSPDDAALGFAFAEAAARDVRLQVVAAYPWPLHSGAGAPGEVVSVMADQEAVEHETRVLADGFLAPHRARHPGVRAQAYVTPGDAAGARRRGPRRRTDRRGPPPPQAARPGPDDRLGHPGGPFARPELDRGGPARSAGRAI